jgi:hypothetical protein
MATAVGEEVAGETDGRKAGQRMTVEKEKEPELRSRGAKGEGALLGTLCRCCRL